MAQFEDAVQTVRTALARPAGEDWGWHLRTHLRNLRLAIIHEPIVSESWLASRCGQAQRERMALISRIATLSPIVLAGSEHAEVRQLVERLLHDAERYHQRVMDLIYDSVELEFGGSE